jgi:hypothetical protein
MIGYFALRRSFGIPGPTTLLQTTHHLHRLAAILGRVVLEPWQDGVPLCGRADREVTCQVCGTTVGGDVARRVDAAPAPYYPHADVCSVTCVRAASADEHRP